MSDIDEAVANYIAASDLLNPMGLVGFRETLKSGILLNAAHTIGRAAGNVRRAGGTFEEPTLTKLRAIGGKLTQAQAHQQQVMKLLDELVADFMSMQGELAGIAAQIAALG